MNRIDTKDLIFEKAIDMFSSNGYENVTMREIANEVGIKAASIYNHFSSKQEILDNIYALFEDEVVSRVPFLEHIKSVIKTGSLKDIVYCLYSLLDTEKEYDQKRIMQMYKIVCARVYMDHQASRLLLKVVKNSMFYIINVLNYGIEIGRFNPFDTRMYAKVFVIQQLEMKFEGILFPDKPDNKYSEMLDFMAFILPESDTYYKK